MRKEASTYSCLFEGMNSIRPLLADKLPENDRTIRRVLVDETKKKAREKELGFLSAKSKELNFPIEFRSPEEIADLSTGASHGGILAEVSERTIPTLPDELPNHGFIAYLEGIEDPYNFGYAIRSLYAAGAQAILLPERNWMEASGVVARSSAGCSEKIPMYVFHPEEDLSNIKKAGYKVACAGIRDSVSAWEADLTGPVLLIVGGEKRGISASTLAMADVVIRIDYGREFKGSLSAASAATILGYEILRQNTNKTNRNTL